MHTLEGTVLIESSCNFVRMIILIKSRSPLKMGHVGSKTRLLSQIIEKPCVHSRGHSFDPTFMKLCQKDDPHEIKVTVFTLNIRTP